MGVETPVWKRVLVGKGSPSEGTVSLHGRGRADPCFLAPGPFLHTGLLCAQLSWMLETVGLGKEPGPGPMGPGSVTHLLCGLGLSGFTFLSSSFLLSKRKMITSNAQGGWDPNNLI